MGIDVFMECADRFYNKIEREQNARDRMWEYGYSDFYYAIKDGEKTISADETY